MRPHQLSVEGFSCFKQRQDISFEGLELFAIWGATGSGKTSLLDAIVFALFGKVPRLDERRNRDVISLTRDKAVVWLEFSTGPRRFRVVRTARRKGAPEAKLEDADGNRLAEGVRDVEAAIQRHLGLSYDAFIQSVMLPQGEFARFLKSEPRQRRIILRDLLRLDVYERMRSAAEQRRADQDRTLTALTQLLADYAEATPENLATLEASLRDAQEQQDAKHGRLTQVEECLRALQALRTKTEELEQLRRHLDDLDRDTNKIAAIELRIAAAERAAAVMPDIARAEQREQAARDEVSAAERARAAVTTREKELAAAEGAMRKAEEGAKQIGPLRERVRALDGLRGILDARRAVLTKLENARNGARDAVKSLLTAREQLDGLERKRKDLQRKLKTADDAVRAAAYDQSLDTLAQQAAREATQLDGYRKTLTEARGEMARTASESTKAAAAVAKKALAVDRARQACEKTADALRHTETAYRDAHQRHAAAILRRDLRKGEACPVCEHRVDAVPKPIAVPKLDAMTKEYEEAKQAEADARQADKKLAAEYAGLAAESKKAAEAADKAKTAVKTADNRVVDQERKLAEMVGGKFDNEPGKTLDARVLSGCDRLARGREQHAAKLEQLRALERDRDVAVTAIDGKNVEVQQMEAAAKLATHQVADLTTETNALTTQITAVTTRPDPLAESAEIEKKIEGLGGQLETAKTALTEANANLTTARAVAAGAGERATAVAEDAAELRRIADATVNRSGFDSAGAAKVAVVAVAELTGLRKAIQAHQADRQATEQRVTTLNNELGGDAVTEAQLTEAKEAHERAKADHSAAIGAVATLKQQIQNASDRLSKRAEYATQQEQLKTEYGVYRELAEELKTDRFQEFVLEESFHDLTRGASQRLGDLTGRYALQYENGNILVVDHDNADGMRSADTLSGGETFLASLALALQLSEQIQQASGAALLESLFIDEGFGTLDVESLNGAASAIESLHGGGRMVGIITHIRDLADRLPCRIEVDWHSDGSRVETYRL